MNILNQTKVFLLILFGILTGISACGKNAPPPAEVIHYTTNFYTPFEEQNRDKWKILKRRIISGYGDYRATVMKGHKHAGIDLKAGYKEKIYPIGKGKVLGYRFSFPNYAIIVRHHLTNGQIIYSQYTHIIEPEVTNDQWVDEHTVLARMFNQEELKKAQFTVCHLHLEIRTNIDDHGKASYTCMSMEELDKYCLNPAVFLKKHLR